MIKMNNVKVFAVTKQGSNHIKTDKECQDYSLAIRITDKNVEIHYGIQDQPEIKKQQGYKNKKPVCCMAIVADGHGGDEFIRSAKGSQFAVESARTCIADFLRLKKGKPIEKDIKQLIQSILKMWNEKVENDVSVREFGTSELANLSNTIQEKYKSGEERRHAYGTTLIASVVCEKYWFGIHIGDGRCTVLNQDGTFKQPISWDDRCFLNATTSICDEDACERARVYIIPDNEPIPVGIFLCSDGIDDSYPVNDNEKYLYKFYRTLALNFLNNDAAIKDIQDMLPKLSEKGSGDDMSIAGIIDMDNLNKIEAKLREQIASEKANAEQPEVLAQKEEKEKICLEMIDKKRSEKVIESYGHFSGTNQTGTNIDQKV